MRNTKKVISILLTLLMVVGMMSTFAFAEGTGTGSITIDNPTAGKTYTAYKIFDATASGTNYSYTIDTNSAWFNAVDTYSKKIDSALKLTQIGESNKYIAKFGNGTTDTAADFAKDLKTAYNTMNPKPTDGKALEANAAGAVTVNGLDLGYYFVTTDAGSLCMLTTANPNQQIKDKNEGTNFDKKATTINAINVPVASNGKTITANVGDKIAYEITVNVPSTKGYSRQIYIVSDKLDSGLTFNNDVILKIDNTDITDNEAVTKTSPTPNNTTFQYKIDMTKLQTYIGKTIKITYTATLKNSAVDVNKNTATLQKNDPDGSTVTVPAPPTVTVNVGGIKVLKHAEGAKETVLEGAKFVLKNNAGKFYKASKLNDNNEYVKLDNIIDNTTVDKVEWVDTQDKATEITTGTDGIAYFKGIETGTYTLIETKAPDGYNMLKEGQSVKVDAKTGTVNTGITYTVADVANSTGSELPETGGIGTTIFYLIGAILVIGAGVVFVTRRRMHSEK